MPIGYIQAPVREYVGLDVGFLNQKAMERQNRHDQARALWSESVQNIAGQEFLDNNARQQFLAQQEQLFNDVIQKHSGNLSAGYQDVLGAIEKAKLNPYHNVNRRQVEQAKIQQKLQTEYGADYIDVSKGLNKPLYTTKDGQIEWINPSEIQAGALRADDYAKVFEQISADFKPRMFSIEEDLKRSNNPYYLQAITTGNKALLNEVMLDEYINKYGIDAFINTSDTWSKDTRDVMGYNPQTGLNKWLTTDASGNVIPNREALGRDLKSFIADRMTDNPFVGRQFVQNVGNVEALRSSYRKKEMDYAEELKKSSFAEEPNYKVPLGTAKLDAKGIAKLSEEKKAILGSIENIKSQNNKIDGKLKEIYGESRGRVFNTDHSINEVLLKQSVENYLANTLKITKDNPNYQDIYNRELLNTKADITTQLSNMDKITKYNKDLEYYNEIDKTISNNIVAPEYEKVYDNLTKYEQNYLANELGIENSKESFKNNTLKIQEYLNGRAPGILSGQVVDPEFKAVFSKFNKVLPKISEKIEKEGVDLTELYVGVGNIDPNAPVNKLNRNFESYIQSFGDTPAGKLAALATFTDPKTGLPLVQSDPRLLKSIDDEREIVSITPRYREGGKNEVVLVVNYKDGKPDVISGRSDVNESFFKEYRNDRAKRVQIINRNSSEYSEAEKAEVSRGEGVAQFGDAINNALNIVDAGQSVTKIPYHVVKNGVTIPGDVILEKGTSTTGEPVYYVTIPNRNAPLTKKVYRTRTEAEDDIAIELGKRYLTFDESLKKAAFFIEDEYAKNPYYLEEKK